MSQSLYGAGERSRTPDMLITNQLLYQLSYASKRGAILIEHTPKNHPQSTHIPKRKKSLPQQQGLKWNINEKDRAKKLATGHGYLTHRDIAYSKRQSRITFFKTDTIACGLHQFFKLRTVGCFIHSTNQMSLAQAV